MKNEERIVELLDNSLKKQDQQNELLNVLVQGQVQLLSAAKETNERLATMEKNLIGIT